MEHEPAVIRAVGKPRWWVIPADDVHDAVDIQARYVEQFYLPKLGPTALMLARRLAYDAKDVLITSREYRVDMLGAEIGVSFTKKMPETLLRLIGFGIVDEIPPYSVLPDNMVRTTGAFAIHRTVPLLNEKQRRRLPSSLQTACLTATTEIEAAVARAR